ncbi:MAG: InlB B-repeat-containing protein [Clostridia bacterium]|nr:InlB B-repeat-containing protein [Clostridia bacterium]
MKKRIVAMVTTVCLLLSLMGGMILPVSAEEAYVPYVREMEDYPEARTLRVAAQEDLEVLSEAVRGSQRLEGYTILQTADIIMEGEFIPIGENYNNAGDYNFSNSFKGTYDGQGYTISDLVINLPSTNGVGLFGSAIGATIMNVGIESGSVIGANRVGGIAGYADNSTLINCYNKADIYSTSGVDGTGGIAGVARNYATILGCYNLGTVTATAWAAAGICGWGQGNLTLKGCYSGGKVQITNPQNDDHAGMDVMARNSTDSGVKYSDSYYLTGICDDEYNSWGSIKLDAFDGPRIAYALNTAQGFNNDRFTVDEKGELQFRRAEDPVIIEVTQRLLRSGVRLETSELYFVGDGNYMVPAEVNGAKVLNASVDGAFYEIGASIPLGGEDLLIELTVEGTYPSVAEANTAESEVYTVGTAEELAAMAAIVNGGNALSGKTVYVTADLDFSAYKTWEPIGFLTESPGGVPNEGATPFSGTFDGQFYHFKNINFTQSGQYQALFRFVENGLVQNIVIDEGTLWSDDVRPASIVSMLHDSTVRNIESHLDVFSNSTANSKNIALVALSPGSTIESCINYGSMGYEGAPERQENAGITACGYESNKLRNCIVAGPIYGQESALIARRTNATSITRCYALPSLEGASANLNWDQLLSGEAAWILNTDSGNQTNSGLWSQTPDGPVLDPDHPVYRVTFQPTDSYHELLDEFYGYYAEGYEVTLPEVNGYTLAAASCNGVALEDGFIMSGEDMEVELYLENKEYLVQYVLNGGKFLQTPKETFTVGYAQSLPTADTLEKTGYVFAGWYDNEALSGEAVTLISNQVTHGLTYYAKWDQAVEISTPQQLASITDLAGHYIMTNDIDMNGISFTPIGTVSDPFTGSFDGNGYTIHNLSVDTTENNQGLFGSNAGVIRNVTLADDCMVYGDVNVGGIAGKNTGLITDCVSDALVISNPAPAAEYKIWAQNLCQWGGDARKPAMLQRANAYQPDLCCFQEASEAWNNYIATNFKGYTLHYKYRGDKESAPVAWKTDRFDVVESGHFWLSETPEKQSMGWDAACYRICSWAVLKDKETGDMLAMYSIHLDHVGVVARREGCKVVRERIYDLRDRYPGIMLFAAGDFNCGENSEAYEVFTTGGMADARYMTSNTTNALTHGDISGSCTSIIDFITTYEDAVEITKFEVLDERYNNLRPSDHAGLLATFHAKSALNYGAITGSNEGTIQRSAVNSLVLGETNAGLAIGANNGTAENVFYSQWEGFNTGATTPTGTGDSSGFAPLYTVDLQTVYALNREAGSDMLTLIDGELAPVGGRDLPIPVCLTVNGSKNYLLSGTEYYIDTSGYTDPVITLNGMPLSNKTIAVPDTDSVVVIQEKTDCTEHIYNTCIPVDETTHRTVCANNPAHYVDAEHRFERQNVGSGCYEAGYAADVCADCGYEVLMEETPVEGHDFGAWQKYDDQDHQRICSKDPTHIEYAPHTFDEGVAYEAGCGEFGVIRYTCSCGYYYDEITAAREGTAHEWQTEDAEPTCEEAGGTRTFCEACGRSTIDGTIPATGHDWSAWKAVNSEIHRSSCGNNKDHVRTESHQMDGGVVVAPACGENGYTRHSCITCGYYFDTDVTEALAHEWGDWSVESNATADRSGRLVRQCAICEDFDYRMLPSALDTAVIAEADNSESGFVTVTVKLQNNPGLASLQLQMTYDPAVLQPLGGDALTRGDALGKLTFGSGLEGDPNGSFKVTWVGASDDNSDGTLFTVKFKGLQEAETKIGLTVVPNTAFNGELEAVTVYDQDADTSVHNHRFVWDEEKQEFVCACGGKGGNDGDMNRDGTVDTADVSLLLRYLAGMEGLKMDPNAADYNGDQSISVADAVLILRMLSA